ncbi:Chromatin-modifying protein 1a [Plasmodiophora brassicae]|uniref:Chromatin-modifying protein 1a n=1 Tax=Plasmodiophora brassicae TaxID=37360 RepID=A0A0G4IWF5_PLABS|nr:hypothetical protein PBRA_007371 [Plasmodiophora brassicae]SPQ98027.1 unnamed protein product [Plasmodiophora brassicae]
MSLDDYVFNLRFMSKQLARQSVKAEKEEKASKLKCKKAMEKGNMDGARIYAQNAIRQKNEALNYLRLSSRIDAVAARCNTAAKTQTLTRAMGGVVKNMDKAMASMNLEAISSTMDKFEQQFEDLDLRAEYMDNAIGSSSALTTPDDQVQSLMHQVADEHNLEFQSNLNAVGVGKAKPQQVEEKEDDDLEERLKRLQGI